MANKTLYDILEVSESASHETIRAAYERLSRKFDPATADPIAVPDAATRYTAVKEAFLTLGNTDKRVAYDRRLSSQWQAAPSRSAWSMPKLLLIAVLAICAVGGYSQYKGRQEEARLAQEKAIAAAKAKEAEALAHAERERARAEQRAKAADERQIREREMNFARFRHEQRVNEVQSRIDVERERMQTERAAAQRRAEEAQAARVAQMRATQERAALCNMERARYGRAISC